MTNNARSSNTPDSPPTSIPLIVGVTGHRDLMAEDVPRIRELVRSVLQTLKKKYPHTPLVLLSPLAEGADQLVAEVALEADIGARLVAVLRWPGEFSFEAPAEAVTLAHGADAARFRLLLDRATHVVAMPLDDEAGRLARSAPAAFEERQNELVGKFIARHSQMLIALWDGRAPESSGTARVVEWQRNGAPAPFAAQLGELDVVEGAPICHILVRRKSQPEATAVSGSPTPKYLYPTSAGPSEHKPEEQIHRAWGNIDRFNRDVSELQQATPQAIATSRSWVLPDDVANRLTPPLRELFEYYALADATALSFQNRVKSLVCGGCLSSGRLPLFAWRSMPTYGLTGLHLRDTLFCWPAGTGSFRGLVAPNGKAGISTTVLWPKHCVCSSSGAGRASPTAPRNTTCVICAANSAGFARHHAPAFC